MDYASQGLTTYNDFQGLAGLRAQAKNDQSKAVDKVSEQFESMFLHMMLKEMRKTVPDSVFFDSPAVKTFQDMQDQQMALELAKEKPLGIADMLKTNLASQGIVKTDDDSAKHQIKQPSMTFELNKKAQGFGMKRPANINMALDAYKRVGR